MPEHRLSPVIVLSNNDGCVIARSNEAKAIGIKMGTPFFQLKELIIENNIIVFSSHYALYGDMSERVMNNLARFSPDVEVYSIDECFLKLNGFPDLETYMMKIKETIIKNTGIPVSVGCAPTKTLAKLANKLAKKGNGVCLLDNEDKINSALLDYPVEDVWGIGRQYANKLISLGIDTAEKFRSMPIEWVNKNMSVVGVRLWRELKGESCLPLKTVLPTKKGMCTSRAFGKLTDDYEELTEATTNYVSRLAFKLRREKLCTSVLSVRLLTNRFRADLEQACPAITIALDYPINNTPDLIKEALKGLKLIFIKGYQYQKVEVMATGLIPESEVQLNIFSSYDNSKNKISDVLDRLNNRFGKGTVKVASEGINKKWNMKRKFLTPDYTNSWSDIIKVK
jgi:DNA polymerase V